MKIEVSEEIRGVCPQFAGVAIMANVKNTPYCITEALINSVKGNIEKGLIFCGSNVYKAKEIISVHNLMNELVTE